MTAPLNEERWEKLLYFFKGNADALSLAVDLLFLSELVDDLVDRDVERSVEDVKHAFRLLLVDNPNNPFMIEHFHQISPMIASTFLMWLDSTSLEQGSQEERFIAFHIRNTTVNILHHFIFILGGPSWAEEVGPDFWRTFAKPKKIKELIDELKSIGEKP